MSVTKGEHLEVVDDTFSILFWIVRSNTTQKKGYVLADILMNCSDHSTKCVISTENYDASLYLTFMKGDPIVLDMQKQLDDGWLYGKQKFAEGTVQKRHIRSSFSNRRQQGGYIHPYWVNTAAVFIGLFALKSFGVGMNIVDVITDILNGLDYIDGRTLPSNVTIICDELSSYSHPIWGSVAIGLTWLPALPICVSAIAEACHPYNSHYSWFESLKKCLCALMVFASWPISSVLM